MPSRPKGFDPLSSLFESSEPEPTEDAPQPPSGATPPDFAPVLEPTDSFFSAPSGGPRAPVARVAAATAQPPVAQPPAVDPVALAKILAKTAATRAGPLRASPKQAAAPAPAASTPPVPARPTSSGPPASRIDELARRTVHTRTAEEVLAEMAHSPARRAPTPRPAEPLPGLPVGEVQAIIAQRVKGIGEFRVANCIGVKQPEVLKALWKAHRTRFAAEGRLDQAVAAATVLDALDRIPLERLAVAHVLTVTSDYLLWLDTADRRLIAAFTDARAFLAGR